MDYWCEEEKEDNKEKDMDVCMVPIRQYIIQLKEGIEKNNQARRGRKMEDRRERSALFITPDIEY